MPGRKAKKTPAEQPPQDHPDTQNEAFEKLSEKLTATFVQGFDKLQQAIVNMAEQSAAQPRDAPQQKRQATDDIQGYNTRNKALRPIYNPPEELPRTKTKKAPKKPAAAAGKSQDAIAVDTSDVTVIPATPAPAPSVRHYQPVPNVNIPSQLGPNDTALAMNDWIIGQVQKENTSARAFHLPMSASEMPKDTSLEAQVQQVLLNTATHLAKGNQNKGFYPHNYVTRGPEKKKLGLNSLTLLEHLHGILRMIKDQAVPSNIKPYLYSHLEEVIEDARQYDWVTAVRPWSEEIFTLVSDGSLPEGWASHHKIQMLRMTVSRASTARIIPTAPTSQFNQNRPRQPTQNDNLRGGTPCVDFNSQHGCQQPSGHNVNGRKVVHICAFFSLAFSRNLSSPRVLLSQQAKVQQ